MPKTTFGKGISYPGLSDYKYELAEVDEELWDDMNPSVWILPAREEDGTRWAFGFFISDMQLQKACNEAWRGTGIYLETLTSRCDVSARSIDLEGAIRYVHDPYWDCYMPEKSPIFAAMVVTYPMRQHLEEMGRTEFTSDAIHFKDSFGRWTYLYLAAATPAPVSYPADPGK